MFAGVERFLQPLEFSGSSDRSFQKASPLLRSASFLPPESFADKGVDSESQLTGVLLEKLLSESIKHRYQASGQVVVRLSRVWEPLKCSSGIILKIKDCSPDELSSSSFVRFSVWDQGKNLGDYSMPLQVLHLREVLFANAALPRGSKPRDGDFSFRSVDVLKQHANSVVRSSNLSGYELSTNLSIDSPLKWNYLSKATLIRKGQVVDVFASGSGIFVTMKGLALEDGVVGSLVKVRNLSSEKEFHAKVLNENSVKVAL